MPITEGLIDAGSPKSDAGLDAGNAMHAAVALVEADLWVAVPLDVDPFASWTDEPVSCSPIAGYYPELDSLEVDTTRCNFVTLAQPLRVALPPGAELEVEVIHFDLAAAEPSEARLALSIASQGIASQPDAGAADSVDPVWERTVAIPGPANRIVDRFTLERGASPGDRILFHLQNHGQNTWRLVRVVWLP